MKRFEILQTTQRPRPISKSMGQRLGSIIRKTTEKPNQFAKTSSFVEGNTREYKTGSK